MRTPAPHDLLLVGDRASLTGEDGSPLPAAATDDACDSVGATDPGAWVVTRRARHEPGIVPVGIRGRLRSQRCAARVPADAVVRVVRPWHLPHAPAPSRLQAAAFQALALTHHRLDAAQERGGFRWGPTGSVGFELASGRAVVTADSDLDVLVHAPHPLEPAVFDALLTEATGRGWRLDVQVVTAHGGFALAEWLRARGGPIAVRTVDGPVLTHDPWRRDR